MITANNACFKCLLCLKDVPMSAPGSAYYRLMHKQVIEFERVCVNAIQKFVSERFPFGSPNELFVNPLIESAWVGMFK